MEKRGAATVIRPDALNALSGQILDELIAAFAEYVAHANSVFTRMTEFDLANRCKGRGRIQ
ncbi:hypothetical protein EEB18_021410 [Sphingopyxis sp. OPL5]|uniref:hypothetical protein n=1 Tax=Sphingopyxis sp. OPL5 TaxID=2486273 RepID=UPI001656B154|nr:hypothetical protein [Sphingopyxis sp. OPL5]QNO27229.1 hypothetical protein EEB18_021410 [Sphingopyxis sp. OPL5]